MVAEPRIYVDVEAAVRAWAREAVASIPNVYQQGRVFFGANPALANQGATQIVLERISGPDDECLIQFDVWSGKSKRASAATTAAALATAADALGRYVHGSTLLLGARVENPGRWLPDEASDMPRYVVEVTFVAFSTQGM